MKTRRVEKNIGLMIILVIVAISFGGLVESFRCFSRTPPSRSPG